MSTVSVDPRPTTLRRPLYRRPDWDDRQGGPRSNTWGHGAVRTRSQRRYFRHIAGATSGERSFEQTGTLAQIRRRAGMVMTSPGVSVVSIAAMVLLFAVAPTVTSQPDGPVTPSGSTTVTVPADASLSDVARDHVPGAPVGDAVARIASMNDVSTIGAGDDDEATRTLTVPVY